MENLLYIDVTMATCIEYAKSTKLCCLNLNTILIVPIHCNGSEYLHCMNINYTLDDKLATIIIIITIINVFMTT